MCFSKIFVSMFLFPFFPIKSIRFGNESNKNVKILNWLCQFNFAEK